MKLTRKSRIEKLMKITAEHWISSTRKRIPVIVRDEEGKLLLLCKGADSVMFERLGKNGRYFEEGTGEHCNEYADAGLRTLILDYRELGENEYKEFDKKFSEAKSSISVDRETLIDDVTGEIEKDLILLGTTAVEDKLQQGFLNALTNLPKPE